MKKVLVYTSKGPGNNQTFETSATTFAELQEDLGSHGVIFKGMKVVVGLSRVTLESPHAILPDEDFTLFLMPVKTKSGKKPTESEINSMSFKELRDEMKEIFKTNPKAKKEFFIDGSKNWTQLSLKKIKELLTKWYYGDNKKTEKKAEVSEEAKKEINKVVQSVKKKKSIAKKDAKPEKVEEKVEEKTEEKIEEPVKTEEKETPKTEEKVSEDTEQKTKEQVLTFVLNIDKEELTEEELKDYNDIVDLIHALNNKVNERKAEEERIAEEKRKAAEKKRLEAEAKAKEAKKLEERAKKLKDEAAQLSKEFPDVYNI